MWSLTNVERANTIAMILQVVTRYKHGRTIFAYTKAKKGGIQNGLAQPVGRSI